MEERRLRCGGRGGLLEDLEALDRAGEEAERGRDTVKLDAAREEAGETLAREGRTR